MTWQDIGLLFLVIFNFVKMIVGIVHWLEHRSEMKEEE